MQKNKKIRRQALIVSISELEELKQSLIKQQFELAKKLGIDTNYTEKFSVPIINKTKCSDTWRIEK